MVEAESPIVLAAALNEHPCSPSKRSTAKRVGQAMARATITILSMFLLSIPIETSARFRRDYGAVDGLPAHFHARAWMHSCPSAGSVVDPNRGRQTGLDGDRPHDAEG